MEKPVTPRKPWLASLLSILCPGLGLLYAGKPLVAAAFSAVLMILMWLYSLVLCASVSGIYGSYALVTLYFAVSMGYSYFVAKRATGRHSYQRLSVYILFYILSIALHAGNTSLAREFGHYETYNQNSGSMSPAIVIGEKVVADQWIYGKAEVQRGDVIVFREPKSPRIILVKRVVGLPGDTIAIHSNELRINGAVAPLRPLNDPKLAATLTGDFDKTRLLLQEEVLEGVAHPVWIDPATQSAADFGPVTVPPGAYFCLGDNRSRSSDSRNWGFVPKENIRGKVVFIFSSRDSARIGMRVR